LGTGRLHVRRAKSGDASVHPIAARESRALRKLLREAPTSPYVFISERRAPLSVAGYQRMVARAGVAAKFTFLVHSHMLRHACGFKLANDGHDTRAIQAYLGHRSIMSTVQPLQKLLEGLPLRPTSDCRCAGGDSCSLHLPLDYNRELESKGGALPRL